MILLQGIKISKVVLDFDFTVKQQDIKRQKVIVLLVEW
jgi:hypothetical protein